VSSGTARPPDLTLRYAQRVRQFEASDYHEPLSATYKACAAACHARATR
jgi:hypothetical protein